LRHASDELKEFLAMSVELQNRRSESVQQHRSNLQMGGDSAVEKMTYLTLFQVSRNVVLRIGRDNLTLVAAGVAFYAMTAIFPAIAGFVSIYGLFADPSAMEQQIAPFSSLLPANSLKLLIYGHRDRLSRAGFSRRY
jgi:Virulence factor BrkB